jgi:hypothetical protein
MYGVVCDAGCMMQYVVQNVMCDTGISERCSTEGDKIKSNRRSMNINENRKESRKEDTKKMGGGK